ncbi:hypothetical protein GGTG_08258 [Gaeumannomyces tritici R3-111a-1]|uniref:Uncharacterized protein n=1 Tax=Gaeumannomyces tritici (strain R3-111a-1) TaxID=644352 RepID=J3P421_GAET3|nr:hypothetical protein GGTG_08258 [Gaeumannomyces tritici R3-111a-1]EJT74417.1 hypothetical protein GGTG_08258 [Gaeumannomyces tritici R3-111a-1]
MMDRRLVNGHATGAADAVQMPQSRRRAGLAANTLVCHAAESLQGYLLAEKQMDVGCRGENSRSESEAYGETAASKMPRG